MTAQGDEALSRKQASCAAETRKEDCLSLGAFGQIIYLTPKTDRLIVGNRRTRDDLGLAELTELAAKIAHAVEVEDSMSAIER